MADITFSTVRESAPRSDSRLLWRLRSEYCEMPGLSLTVAQASRLCQIDHAACQSVLEDLTRAGFLMRDEDRYVRVHARV